VVGAEGGVVTDGIGGAEAQQHVTDGATLHRMSARQNNGGGEGSGCSILFGATRISISFWV